MEVIGSPERMIILIIVLMCLCACVVVVVVVVVVAVEMILSLTSVLRSGTWKHLSQQQNS